MKLAFLCPGQGAQSPGFLGRLPRHAEVERTLDEASVVLQRDARRLDSALELRSTVATQLSIVIAGVALARALEAQGLRPDAVAGLSVGAFTAAVIVGSLVFDQALRVVLLRATLMEQAYPQGYGMAVIVGLGQRSVEDILRSAAPASATAEQRVYLANFNGPSQFVIAGADHALEQALRHAQNLGARRAERLDVAVPSHCVLLSSVAHALRDALLDSHVHAPRVPYVGNRSGRLLGSAEAITADLADSVMAPVRWHDGTTVLLEHGVRQFIELPPGQTLTQLAQSTFDTVRAVSAEGSDLRSLVLGAQRFQTSMED
ncbi:Malonyl CoA-acyl carrier protein transacylase [Thiomonas sp. X19]|uniref:ACP S-malonyltransferase n=1 Tax=Thiomonas sp. X19 TaxID=1050370 RepID=UPI000B65C5B1|nr:malonate decarboxylase subunit epsilon [Thiomonas sp. X19]SCC94232.1 Malonyl CoA-acyl carrier protein transacylase [Thiomonas sp. X19]